MEIAKVKVSAARCTPESVGTITRGMMGTTVSIEYTDPLWDNLTKTVVFQGSCTKDVLSNENIVTVPAEVVATAGKQLKVGVYGVDADNNLVIPTLWAELGEIQGAASPSGDSTTETTPPVWAQIQAVANNAEAIAKSVREDADAGAFIGPVGPTGAAAVKLSDTVEYQSGISGDTIPSGTWSTRIPPVLQGEYLWTRTTTTFNTGTPVVSYSVTRFGLDGVGSVSSVCNVSPDSGGNVPLTADDVGALPSAGGTMTGAINMQGRAVTGLNAPTEDSDAARKSYVDCFANSRLVRNLLDNSDFTNPVAQADVGGSHGTQAYALDRWILNSGTASLTKGTGLTLNGTISQKLENTPSGVVSAFIGMNSGTATIACSDGAVTITSAGGIIKWAAIYEGEYTADTLPPYVPKGYAVELAECQRYFRRDSVYVNTPTDGNGNSAPVCCHFFPKMKKTPSATFVKSEGTSAGVNVYRLSEDAILFSAYGDSNSIVYWYGYVDLVADI